MAEKESKPAKKRNFWIKSLLGAAVTFAAFRTALAFYADSLKKRMEKEEQENKENAYKTYNISMGGREINVEGKFSGASIKSFFSGVSLNLQNAQIDSDVFLNVRNVFGGVDIKVPKGMNVHCDEKEILGGVVISVPEYEGEEVHTIYIRANTILGGICIRAEKGDDGVVQDYFEENTFNQYNKDIL